MKSSTLTLWALFLLAGCTQQSSEPQPPSQGPESTADTDPAASRGHIKLIPKDPIAVISMHPGQIMEKLAYDEFLNKPAIAYAYSIGADSFLGFGSALYDAETEDPKRQGLYTRMLEKPAETTGINPEVPILLSVHNLTKLEFRILANIEDVPRFETFVLQYIKEEEGAKTTWSTTAEGRRIFPINEKTAIAHDGTSAVLCINSTNPSTPLGKLADKWFIQTDSRPKLLEEQLKADPDLGAFLPLKPFYPFIMLAMGEDGPPPAYLAETSLSLSLNSAKGQVAAELHVDLGASNELKFGGEPIAPELLGHLPADAFLKAALSLDLESSLNQLQLLLPFTDFSAEEIKEQFGIDFEDLPKLLNGQVAFALTGIQEDSEDPAFLAAIGTRNPAAEVYARIFQKGILRAFRGGLDGQNPLDGMSITTKGNRLLIATINHAQDLELEKSAKPLSEGIHKSLEPPLFNLTLDIPQLLDVLDLDDQRDPENEEFIVGELLGRMQQLRVQVRQSAPTRYSASTVLQLHDKQTQGLRTLAHLGADLANPYFRHPQFHKKLKQAEQLAEEDPLHFKRLIIGHWAGDQPISNGVNHYRAHCHKNGTSTFESIWLGKDGYSRHTVETSWITNGNIHKLYTEHGAIDFTFIFLAIDDSTLTAIDIGNAIRSNRFEAFTNRRVSADYKLPDPPEGLRELNDQ